MLVALGCGATSAPPPVELGTPLQPLRVRPTAYGRVVDQERTDEALVALREPLDRSRAAAAARELLLALASGDGRLARELVEPQAIWLQLDSGRQRNAHAAIGELPAAPPDEVATRITHALTATLTPTQQPLAVGEGELVFEVLLDAPSELRAPDSAGRLWLRVGRRDGRWKVRQLAERRTLR